MPLEDPDTIDIVAETKDGRLLLIITDAGLTADPEERLEQLRAKLKTYVLYAMSPGFSDDYPGVDLAKVGFHVICNTEPTTDMRNITEVCVTGDDHREFPLTYGVSVEDEKRCDAPPQELENKERNPQTQLTASVVRAEVESLIDALEKGADIDHVDPLGFAPLDYAVCKGDPPIVRLLLDRGAKFPERTAGGRVLWVTAKSKGFSEIVRILETHGVAPSLIDRAIAVIAKLRSRRQPTEETDT